MLTFVTVLVAHGFELVTNLIAVGESARGARVAGNQNVIIFRDDAADASTITGGAGSDHSGNIYKVLIPRGTFGS